MIRYCKFFSSKYRGCISYIFSYNSSKTDDKDCNTKKDSSNKKDVASKTKSVHWNNNVENYYFDPSNTNIFERDVECMKDVYTQTFETDNLNNILDYNVDLEFSNVQELAELSSEESEGVGENAQVKEEMYV